MQIITIYYNMQIKINEQKKVSVNTRILLIRGTG